MLPIPNHYYSSLARWHQLAMMKGTGDLRELAAACAPRLDPAPLQDFITIVDHDLGFALYRAPSSTPRSRCRADRVEFRFAREGIDIGRHRHARRFRGAGSPTTSNGWAQPSTRRWPNPASPPGDVEKVS